MKQANNDNEAKEEMIEIVIHSYDHESQDKVQFDEDYSLQSQSKKGISWKEVIGTLLLIGMIGCALFYQSVSNEANGVIMNENGQRQLECVVGTAVRATQQGGEGVVKATQYVGGGSGTALRRYDLAVLNTGGKWKASSQIGSNMGYISTEEFQNIYGEFPDDHLRVQKCNKITLSRITTRGPREQDCQEHVLLSAHIDWKSGDVGIAGGIRTDIGTFKMLTGGTETLLQTLMVYNSGTLGQKDADRIGFEFEL